jgi:Bacterial protein of unknown function (DUF922)
MSGPPGPQTDPFSQNVPASTPGPLGHNDGGDPNAHADLGPTPGPLGVNDHATPHSGRPVHTPARGGVMVADGDDRSPHAKLPVEGWPSTLDWSQFPVIPRHPTGVTEDAQTGSDVPAMEGITIKHDKKGFYLGEFTVKIRLDPDKTWLVKGKESPPLLKHEQVHWDIAGLNAVELSRTLKALRTTGRAALSQAAQAVQERLAIKGQALQLWYDDESSHGLKPAGQKAWEERVAKAIRDDNAALPSPPQKYLDQARKEQAP